MPPGGDKKAGLAGGQPAVKAVYPEHVWFVQKAWFRTRPVRAFQPDWFLLQTHGMKGQL
jgi:hypothetical protein